MMDETKNQEESTVTENLLGVGQRILGNIESIGGILTGDPVTAAEGEFNAGMGAAHQESNRVLTAIEREQEDAEGSDRRD